VEEFSGAGPLAPLGIDDLSDRIYRFVLRNPGASMVSICEGVGVSAATLAAGLAPLVECRLVRVTDEAVAPEPPDVALRRLLNVELRRLAHNEERLLAAQSEVGAYVSEHVMGRRGHSETLPLDRVQGGELTDVIRSLIASANGEMLWLRPDQWYLPTGPTIDADVAGAISAGCASRAIYPAVVAEELPESVLARARAGEQIRLAPMLPTRMAVFGTDTAILPEFWEGESSGRLVIRQPGIVSACIELFNRIWEHSVTLPGFGSASVDADVRRQLLELLAHGSKDEQISRALGMSLRTVRRRIADLLAELGVHTRFQAGMEAVRRGWL
jgi:DNA-binding transcriptional ArsR family regulator